MDSLHESETVSKIEGTRSNGRQYWLQVRANGQLEEVQIDERDYRRFLIGLPAALPLRAAVCWQLGKDLGADEPAEFVVSS